MCEQLVVLVVESELRVAEVEVSEDFVFLEHVVADDNPIRRRRPVQGAQLLVTMEQKIELRLESRTRLILVEALQKWVVLGVPQTNGLQAGGENLRQTGLAHTDRSFNRDESRRLVLWMTGHLALFGLRTTTMDRPG